MRAAQAKDWILHLCTKMAHAMKRVYSASLSTCMYVYFNGDVTVHAAGFIYDYNNNTDFQTPIA